MVLLHAKPGIQTPTIITFFAFVTSILRERRKGALFHWSVACSELYSNYCSHSFTYTRTYLPSSIPSSSFFDLGLICVILHPPWWRSTNCLRTFPKLCRKSPWGYFSVHWVVVDDAKTDFHCVQGLTTFQLFFLESFDANMTIPPPHTTPFPPVSTHTCHSRRFK